MRTGIYSEDGGSRGAAKAIASAIASIPELEEETPRNNLLRSPKCGVYKTGHPGG
jgi:hypothetical protein